MSVVAKADAIALDGLARRLEGVAGKAAVLREIEDVVVYEYDYGLDRGTPDIVVLPGSVSEVQAIVRLAGEAGVPVVARGAGTGISGGAIAACGGVVISTARLRRLIEIDVPNRLAVVQPGVVNLALSKAAEPDGLYFAPDPSSQKASTLGGNVGNNAGGPHCLALGVTTNHVMGLEVVTHDGLIVRLGGPAPDALGYDLTGLFVGSEGTLGVVTEITARLLALPEAVRTALAVFASVEAASEAVSSIIAHGIIPAALEMMDHVALVSIEAAFHAGFPPDAAAVLLVEVDGIVEEVVQEIDEIGRLCREEGATEVRAAASPEERALFWAARKGAASAMGRVAPNYYLHDAVVPRTRLPEVLRRVQEVSAEFGLPIANLLHAGDGNLHPMILFDARQPGIMPRVLEAGERILTACIAVGGTITGEHGVGVEKRDLMPLIFCAADLDRMAAVREAVAPGSFFNPDKLLPTGAGCIDDSARQQSGRRAAVLPVSAPDGSAHLWV